MYANEKPPPQRRRYRRREITIEEPILRPIPEATIAATPLPAARDPHRGAETQTDDRGRTTSWRGRHARLIAAMLADEKFIKAETKRQRDATE